MLELNECTPTTVVFIYRISPVEVTERIELSLNALIVIVGVHKNANPGKK